jgi:hypothetical protein
MFKQFCNSENCKREKLITGTCMNLLGSLVKIAWDVEVDLEEGMELFPSR